ncbi:MAG: mechanosensitive ion channel [Bacteroidaceae bacterium]|nr:mechanosensitive ion channel [Bacteroidaceae bacterium]
MALKWKDLIVLSAVLLFIFGCKRCISGSEMVDGLYYPAIVCSYVIYGLTVFKGFVQVCKLDNRRKDSYNHLLQTAVLICIGIFIVFIILHFNINDKSFLPFSFCAAVLGLIFNDSIKGIVAYYHLRANNLLHIGDWIEVPSQNIDGEIVEITLVTVSVRNWDNTVSNVAIVSLQNGAFKNNQCVMDGLTTGRMIDCTFIVDTSSIHSVDNKEVEGLVSLLNEKGEDSITLARYEAGTQLKTNIHLYRMYINHWLMNNPELTRYPRLIVCIKEPAPDGIPLQVMVFSVKTAFMQYEDVRSAVIEHIILSMEWFGLRLYQRPSLEDMTLFQ